MLAIELATRKIPFRQQVGLPLTYKGIPLPARYRVDFICYGAVLVELKALAAIGPIEVAQVESGHRLNASQCVVISLTKFESA